MVVDAREDGSRLGVICGDGNGCWTPCVEEVSLRVDALCGKSELSVDAPDGRSEIKGVSAWMVNGNIKRN